MYLFFCVVCYLGTNRRNGRAKLLYPATENELELWAAEEEKPICLSVSFTIYRHRQKASGFLNLH